MPRPSPPFALPRLASPFETLKPHYDAVVVGSGYGGGVAAARLARAGLSVCVLERGRELHPGEYPTTLREVSREFQVHGAHLGLLFGFLKLILGPSETALCDLHIGNGMSTLVGCGLGGTSLINANVCLEASDWVFEDDWWPEELRRDRPTRLRAGISRAAEMLQPVPFPGHPWDLDKLRQLGNGALSLGEKLTLPPLAVSFTTGRNNVGVAQGGCRLCGDCCSGCNHGAKNTVLMNYLPYARNHGAEIFTEIRAEWVECRDDAWLVRFRRVGSGEAIFGDDTRFVRADRVILAAGTLGSTEILARSAARGLPISDEVGKRFSGNGDTVHFAYDCRDPVNGVGVGEERLDDHDTVGPTIAGLVDLRDDQGKPEQGFIIEDGSPPGAIGKLMAPMLAFLAAVAGPRPPGVARRVGARFRQLWSLPWRPYEGAVRHTQTHLINSHDGAGGRLSLDEKDRLEISFPEAGNEAVLAHIDEQLKRVSDALGAKHVPNPVWDKFWNSPLSRLWYGLTGAYRRKKRARRDLITVHPLGGCAMASDASRGVVNHKHQVFSGRSGSAVHDSLYVCDGAVIPRSLGVNPLLTIAGLAERACDYLLEDDDRKLEADFPALELAEEQPPPRTLGFRFSERLAGWARLHEDGADREKDYERAKRRAKEAGSTLAVVLDMEIPDLDGMIRSPEHEIRITGVATMPALFDGPAMVTAGSFCRILNRDPDRVNRRVMKYDLRLVTPEGKHYRLEGEKYVWGLQGMLGIWRQTTTLLTRIYDADGDEIARGIIYVGFLDFLKQMVTQRAVRARGLLEALEARLNFSVRFFIGTLFKEAYRPLAPAEAVDYGRKREPRALRAPEPRVISFEARDGVALRLTRYQAGDKGPVLLAHGLGVSSRIFTIDTIGTNLVEALCEAGYDVWLLDYRASTELPHASFRQFTGDDVARNDYPAAIEKVLAETGKPDLQLVVHCFGATTFFMAMLGGYLKPEEVRSVVVSQIATHVVASLDTRLKAGLYAGGWLYWLGWRYPNAYTDTGAGGFARVWNYLLRFVPVDKDERCRSDVCHRISFLYSLLHEHEQLDPETHAALHEMFGAANMTALRHLMEISRQGKIVDADGGDVYIPHMKDRLRRPILFVHGAENYCFKPASTAITFDLLQELEKRHYPGKTSHYERVEIPRYGHIDCIYGKNAFRDVYPRIVDHLDRHP